MRSRRRTMLWRRRLTSCLRKAWSWRKTIWCSSNNYNCTSTVPTWGTGRTPCPCHQPTSRPSWIFLKFSKFHKRMSLNTRLNSRSRWEMVATLPQNRKMLKNITKIKKSSIMRHQWMDKIKSLLILSKRKTRVRLLRKKKMIKKQFNSKCSKLLPWTPKVTISTTIKIES